MQAVQTLLHGLIDYAGLFPPAGLDMTTAVANYAHYDRGPHAWLLGRFVTPVARLDTFTVALAPYLDTMSDRPWGISVLGGADLEADIATIAAFNQQHAGLTLIDTIELRAAETTAIEQALAHVPDWLTAYVELPLSAALDELIATVARLEGRAKVRTGGTTPEMFPSGEDLTRFIVACVAARVPFKATAGLHHPLRAMQRLTYAPDSPSGMMYGFLNVFLAAAFAQAGVEAALVAQVLEERDPAAFRFDADGVRWRDARVTLDVLSHMRQHVALSFGSCSFQEPVDDLKAMHLL